MRVGTRAPCFSVNVDALGVSRALFLGGLGPRLLGLILARAGLSDLASWPVRFALRASVGSLGRLGRLLGSFGGLLRRSWAALGGLLGALGDQEGSLGLKRLRCIPGPQHMWPLGAVLRGSWGPLGAVFGLGVLGGLLGGLLGDFSCSRALLGVFWKHFGSKASFEDAFINLLTLF